MGSIAVKLAKTPPNLAQIVRWLLHCPTQMFLRLRANEKPRFATVHTDVLIAIRLHFAVANYRFSHRLLKWCENRFVTRLRDTICAEFVYTNTIKSFLLLFLEKEDNFLFQTNSYLPYKSKFETKKAPFI